jgi:hypothetical protein
MPVMSKVKPTHNRLLRELRQANQFSDDLVGLFSTHLAAHGHDLVSAYKAETAALSLRADLQEEQVIDWLYSRALPETTDLQLAAQMMAIKQYFSVFEEGLIGADPKVQGVSWDCDIDPEFASMMIGENLLRRVAFDTTYGRP